MRLSGLCTTNIFGFDLRQAQGTLGIDGKMYEIPHLVAAKRTLASVRDNIKS
jgi:hypothetical protein